MGVRFPVFGLRSPSPELPPHCYSVANLRKEFRFEFMMMTLGDKLLISAVLACALAGLFLIPGMHGRGEVAIVEGRDGSRLTLDLSRDGRWEVDGPLGRTVIRIEDGCIRVTESPCPHELCVHMGCRHRGGEIIACIPNRVIVRLRCQHGPARI